MVFNIDLLEVIEQPLTSSKLLILLLPKSLYFLYLLWVLPYKIVVEERKEMLILNVMSLYN